MGLMWRIQSKMSKRLIFLLTGILIRDTALNSVPFLSDGININLSMLLRESWYHYANI